jgi:hypothetical protein
MPSATDELLDLPPYGLPPAVKSSALLAAVHEQLVHHADNCPPYARWLSHLSINPHDSIKDISSVPFLPVNIFKRLFLSSVADSQVVRVLKSSGTSSQVPSQIPLDQTTRNRQMKALGTILSHRLGGQRRPFLILDVPPEQSSHTDRELSARVAGMRGYLLAATEQQYALRRDGDQLTLDQDKVVEIVRRWTDEGKHFCLLGYTYVLYEYVVRPMREQGLNIELPPSTFVVHFGGWKKLRQQAVTKPVFTNQTAEVFGLSAAAIVDIYGFTEQLGVVYPDDSQGVKWTPTYSEVLVRDPRTMEVVPDGAVGLLEFVCPLPHSYPGIAVLLDDMGRIVSRDPGNGEPPGTAFEVVGRAEQAEARGCGDTLPRQIYKGAGPIS